MTATHQHRATTQDLASIVQLVSEMRPDWDSNLISLVLIAHRDQVDAADLAVAAIRAAQDPEHRTPKVIGWRGHHWDGARTKPPRIRDLEICGVCGKPEDRCYSERPGHDDDHDFEPTRKLVPR